VHSICSLFYLAFPVAIFLANWFWWPYALTLVVCLLLLVGQGWAVLRRDRNRPGEALWPASMSAGHALGTAVVTFLVAYFSGVGGFGHQRGDWEKHNAMLTHLTEGPWPVRLGSDSGAAEGSYLTYYVAYYLPATLVGRVLGIEASHLALFVWTLAGLWLSALWVVRLARVTAWPVWAAWFVLSGMDVVPAAFVWLIDTGWTLANGVEFWSLFGAYWSNVGLLLWTPQHMLPGWLATALIVSRAEDRRDGSVAPIVGALTVIWSPFVTLGLVPVALAVLARGGWRRVMGPSLVAAAAIGVACALAMSGVSREAIPRGWTGAGTGLPAWLLTWLGLLLFEFGAHVVLMLAIMRASGHSGDGHRWNLTWLAAAVVTLTVLPVYRLGLYNDLMMRGSIPAYFLLWIVLLRVLQPALREPWRPAVVLLLACLGVGSIVPLNQHRTQIMRTGAYPNFIDDLPSRPINSLPPRVRDQYIGSPDSFYARRLAP
jgi:hypothetical protein